MDFSIAPKIIKFIAAEPKSISEISTHIEKSWKTTDKYLQELQKTNPEIVIKTFRKGSQGALKIAFLKSIMQKSSTEIKDKFFNDFITGKVKDDFDVLDLFMHINSLKKSLVIEEYQDEHISTKQGLISHFNECQQTVYCFSGNLSWINVKENNQEIIEILDNLIKRKVKIKVLCRIDAASLRNIHKLKSLDRKNNTNLIEVRHGRHPLRGFIFDDKMIRLKEEIRPNRYKEGEITNNLRIFYDISEPEWINWLKNIFYSSFNNSMNLASYEKIVQKITNHL